MYAIKPFGSRVMVRVVVETQTKSGLIIARKKEDWQEETLQASVVAVGENTNEEIEVGMTVIVNGHAGKWVDPYLTPDENATHRIIEQDEIIAYVTEVQDA